MTQQKNIAGNLTNVGLAAIGDHANIHYHHHDGGGSLPKHLTLSLPRIDPDEIVGREEELVQLHENLHTGKKVVVVNGVGGIGKTTLARAYVTRYYEEYKHVAWI